MKDDINVNSSPTAALEAPVWRLGGTDALRHIHRLQNHHHSKPFLKFETRAPHSSTAAPRSTSSTPTIHHNTPETCQTGGFYTGRLRYVPCSCRSRLSSAGRWWSPTTSIPPTEKVCKRTCTRTNGCGRQMCVAHDVDPAASGPPATQCRRWLSVQQLLLPDYNFVMPCSAFAAADGSPIQPDEDSSSGGGDDGRQQRRKLPMVMRRGGPLPQRVRTSREISICYGEPTPLTNVRLSKQSAQKAISSRQKNKKI